MEGLLIGELARESGLGVETIRFYHQRNLLPKPQSRRGAYRVYNPEHVSRLRFIRRAQELGFTLAEIEDLLRLNDGTGRKAARELARAKLAAIESKIRDLTHIRKVLTSLVHECERTGLAAPCPIIHLELDRAAKPPRRRACAAPAMPRARLARPLPPTA